MYPHHQESIERAAAHFRTDPEVLALILAGSIAHGFAAPTSDVDVLIVVSDADYETRRIEGRLQYFGPQLCTYEGGYVDGKYLCPSLLQRLALHGSEPARFAFADAQVLFSDLGGIDDLLRSIARYPSEEKPNKIDRFCAQLEAWRWYAHEALRLRDRYLLNVAVGKVVLFAGRLILAHNEILYPFHKWFLKVLESAPDKPADLLARIAALHDDPCAATVEALYEAVTQFRHWEYGMVWTTRFMLDSELAWLDGKTPVDDL